VAKIKSARKRVQIGERNRLRNRSWKSLIRSCRATVAEAVKSGDRESAATGLRQAYKAIDKAVGKGVVHRRSGSRRKSQLARLVNDLVDGKI